MSDLSRAKKLLAEGGYTCALCRGESEYTSEQRGVKPLVQWVEQGTDLVGYSAADKVIGRATAFLYVLLGVRAVYARVISRTALEVLTAADIAVEYRDAVPNIINRQGDGICPFEAAVLDIDDADKAYAVIREKMRQMGIEL